MKKILLFIIPVAMFISGFTAGNILPLDVLVLGGSFNPKAGLTEDSVEKKDDVSIPRKFSETEIKTGIISKALPKREAKYIISQTGPILPVKSQVQTGEEVRFSVELENTGGDKKFLTHICFNHSPSVTFGCIMNKNIFPGEKFSFDASMMFKNPGRYDVWITLSQDKTNFTKPINAQSAQVEVI